MTRLNAIVPGLLVALAAGCCHPEVTAVALSPQNRDEPEGIPFYLPKPLLIISKNFRNIEEPKVGLTEPAPIPSGFDDQAKYGDINARTNALPGANPGDAKGGKTAGELIHTAGAPVTPFKAPSDGLAPETFYTYQIVFVPDLTQKYGLRVKGGAGEIRAAMNLVNGWQFTGLGPYYMKDSSTAQNFMAAGVAANLAGSGVADVVDSLAALDTGGARGGGTAGALDAGDQRVQRLATSLSRLDCSVQPITLPNFAEIHVYEPSLTPDQQMVWTEIACLQFDRQALGIYDNFTNEAAPAATVPCVDDSRGGGTSGGLTSAPLESQAAIINTAVAGVFGVSPNSPALSTVPRGGITSDALSGDRVAVPGAAMTQVQVDCGENCKPAHEFNVFNFGGKKHCHDRAQPVIERRRVFAGGTTTGGFQPSFTPSTQQPVDPTKQPAPFKGTGEVTAGELNTDKAAGRVQLYQTINNHPGAATPSLPPPSDATSAAIDAGAAPAPPANPATPPQ